MIKKTTALEIKIYPPEVQGAGEFDGGRITETKPLAFPREGPSVPNTGPLFYWAWVTAKGYGKIGLHPHQGFEIMSYALKGEIGHYDTLGNRSKVKAGGAQVMQTGSGVSHEEETVGDHTEFFQIWFDPNLKEAVRKPATYREIANVCDCPVGTVMSRLYRARQILNRRLAAYLSERNPQAERHKK